MNPNNMYDIQNFTDNQLFHILNLHQNPSDKELEASIILSINKYSNVNTDMGKTLTQFFNDVYDHFFESEYTQEPYNDDGYDSSNNANSMNQIMENLENMEDTSNAKTQSSIVNNVPNTAAPPIVSLTTPVGFSKDYINPLLKQTIKRIISIDSQYRNISQYPFSTKFTFNLSDTLTNVLSLKLYSVHIPYTWYTISNDYGGNFFYLKGKTPGINNGYHDYKIEIPSGNYNPTDLITEINSSISALKTIHTDIKFGKTGISYGNSNCLSTITVDITKIYNESDYHIDFINTPTGSDTSGNYTDVASFLGYTIPKINTNTCLMSSYNFNVKDPNGNPNVFTLTDKNNYFTIYQYSDALQNGSSITYNNTNNITFIPNYNSNSIIDFSFNVFLTLPIGNTYTRFQLYNNLQQCLQNSTYLHPTSTVSIIDSSNNIYFIDSSNNIYFIDSSNNRVVLDISIYLSFQFTLILNKKTTLNAVNEKMYIQFPSENVSSYNIWTNPDSCFLLNSLTHELNNITSQTPVTTTLYKPTNAKIILTCTKSKYNTSYNEYTIDIAQSSYGYNLFQYLNQINTTSLLNVLQNSNDPPIIFSPLTNSEYNTNISVTRNLSFKFNFTKTFTKEYYTIDLSNTILYDLAKNNNPTQSIDISYNINPKIVDGGDLSFNIIYNGSQYVINNPSLPLLKIVPNNPCGNQDSDTMNILLKPINAIIPNNNSVLIYYTTIDLLVLDLLNSINNYTDPDPANLTPLKGSTVSYYFLPPTQNQLNIRYINLAINLYITKTLTQNDYSVKIQNLATLNNANDLYYNSTPTSINSPSVISGLIFYGLYNKDSMGNTYVNYELSNNSNNIYIQSNITYSEISGNQITSNLLDLTNLPNQTITFYLRPNPNSIGGAYVSNGLTHIDNVIPIALNASNEGGKLTQYSALHQINTQLNENPLTKGSYVYNNYYGNTVFRLNINKIYTADDYVISFYDPYSFVKCYIGDDSVSNITWDQTLGWILGFRELLIYNLSDISSNIKTLIGDTTVTTNLYNYFLIELNDYAQSHINDGLVTVSNIDDNEITLPSYVNKYTLMCDNSGNDIYQGGPTNVGNSGPITSNATQAQIYSANQILNARKNKVKSLTSGPYTQDIFAMIPIKPSVAGQTYIEFGGSLQNQDRIYFGPVNLSRFSVKLLNDRGESLNLNNSNWGFSLLCEQLYNKTAI